MTQDLPSDDATVKDYVLGGRPVHLQCEPSCDGSWPPVIKVDGVREIRETETAVAGSITIEAIQEGTGTVAVVRKVQSWWVSNR